MSTRSMQQEKSAFPSMFICIGEMPVFEL